jgi:hypothetical protein
VPGTCSSATSDPVKAEGKSQKQSPNLNCSSSCGLEFLVIRTYIVTLFIDIRPSLTACLSNRAKLTIQSISESQIRIRIWSKFRDINVTVQQVKLSDEADQEARGKRFRYIGLFLAQFLTLKKLAQSIRYILKNTDLKYQTQAFRTYLTML